MPNENESVMQQFEVVRNVTVPFYIMPSDGSPSFIRFNSPIEVDTSTFSERVRRSKNDENGGKQEPYHIAEITDLRTGEEMRLVAHQVLESTLVEKYPDNGYVGKCFQISKQKAAGKKYFSFNIVEIRLKSSEPSQQAAPKNAQHQGSKK